LLIKSQFTNAQNPLHLNQCTPGQVLLWTITSF